MTSIYQPDVTLARLSEDGTILIGLCGRTAELYRKVEDKWERRWRKHICGSQKFSLMISPDNSYFTIGGPLIYICSSDTGDIIYTLGNDDNISDVCWSHCSRYVAIASSGLIYIKDIQSENLVRVAGYSPGISFSPCGRYFAAAEIRTGEYIVVGGSPSMTVLINRNTGEHTQISVLFSPIEVKWCSPFHFILSSSVKTAVVVDCVTLKIVEKLTYGETISSAGVLRRWNSEIQITEPKSGIFSRVVSQHCRNQLSDPRIWDSIHNYLFE